jgi:hypothetical protein
MNNSMAMMQNSDLFTPSLIYDGVNKLAVYKDEFTEINAPSYSELLKLLYNKYLKYKETNTSPFGERIKVELEFSHAKFYEISLDYDSDYSILNSSHYPVNAIRIEAFGIGGIIMELHDKYKMADYIFEALLQLYQSGCYATKDDEMKLEKLLADLTYSNLTIQPPKS